MGWSEERGWAVGCGLRVNTTPPPSPSSLHLWFIICVPPVFQVNAVLLLLAGGANHNMATKRNKTPIYAAVEKGALTLQGCARVCVSVGGAWGEK
jgi:hypothetical protein